MKRQSQAFPRLFSCPWPPPDHCTNRLWKLADCDDCYSSSTMATATNSSTTAGLGSTMVSTRSQEHSIASRCVKPLQAAAPVILQAKKRCQLTGRFDLELVEALPESLKFISHNGAGYDQIDVDACTKKGLARRHRALYHALIELFRHIRLQHTKGCRCVHSQYSSLSPPRRSATYTCTLHCSSRWTMAWCYGPWARSRRQGSRNTWDGRHWRCLSPSCRSV